MLAEAPRWWHGPRVCAPTAGRAAAGAAAGAAPRAAAGAEAAPSRGAPDTANTSERRAPSDSSWEREDRGEPDHHRRGAGAPA